MTKQEEENIHCVHQKTPFNSFLKMLLVISLHDTLSSMKNRKIAGSCSFDASTLPKAVAGGIMLLGCLSLHFRLESTRLEGISSSLKNVTWSQG